MTRPGFEPTISRTRDQCSTDSATAPGKYGHENTEVELYVEKISARIPYYKVYLEYVDSAAVYVYVYRTYIKNVNRASIT